MFKNRIFKNVLFKWMPHKEQNVCERRLVKVIKRLKIEDFNFNWDRNSCFIEFSYQGECYRLEHSVNKAKEKGIILRNGLDCLNELTQSLEDLCVIIDRGMYSFETWITGMRDPSSAKQSSEYEEEFHIRYKSSGKPNPAELQRAELPRNEESHPFQTDPYLKDYEDEFNTTRKPQMK
ncbi:hypothetical protein [Halobacillus litoralis]|uniref:hypothetical protein n=1 Tax=Halobacillus litoralis TaxID=45668 RepID=UPI001CFC91A2|nr:hypothetical protein [Halobacillus litoralis]